MSGKKNVVPTGPLLEEPKSPSWNNMYGSRGYSIALADAGLDLLGPPVVIGEDAPKQKQEGK